MAEENWVSVTTRKEKNGRLSPTAAFTPATPSTRPVARSSIIRVYQASSGAMAPEKLWPETSSRSRSVGSSSGRLVNPRPDSTASSAKAS